MGSFLVYTFIASVVMTVAFIIFKIFFSREKQIAFNRLTLLAIYALSFASWPLSKINFSFSQVTDNTLLEIGELTSGGVVGDIAPLTEVSHIPEIIIAIYWAGAAVVLLINLISITRLFIIIHSGIKMEKDGYTLVIVPKKDISPFSFGKYVVMSSLGIESVEELVTCHEKAHIQEYHYIDLIVAQIACVILWYNPTSWLMRDELRLIHEYQADARVLSSGADARSYQMLLIKRTVGNKFSLLANGFNHHKLKNRITMMQNENSRRLRLVRAIILVLALGVASASALAVINIPSVAKGLHKLETSFVDSQLKELQQPISIVKNPVKNNDKEVFMAVEEIAEFPGGMKELMNYVMSNIRYPKGVQNTDFQERAIVKFIINDDGSISDARIVRGTSWPELDQEAVRVISTMPKWKPGKIGGKAVSSYFTMPVTFRLKSESAEFN